MFDDSYVTWKSWGGTNDGAAFGHASRYEKSYFAKLLNLAGKPGAGSKVLEIGFGNGGLLAYCQERGYDVIGTEANERLVQLGKSAGYEVHDADFLERVAPDSLDLIIALDVIEHIDPALTAAFLRACRSALKPNGLLVLRFPNGDSPFSVSNFNADATHLNWIGADKLRYYAHMSAYSDVRVLGTPQIILTRSMAHGFYNLFNLPAKWILNGLYRLLFYPGRALNFMAIDLVAILKK